MRYWNGFPRFKENLVRKFNIQQNYVEVNDTWTGILDLKEFVIMSTTDTNTT